MPKLMQIFSNRSDSPGGTERVMAAIARAAVKAGYTTEEYNNMSFPLTPVSRRMPMLNVLGNVWQLTRKLRRQIASCDIVISHGLYGAFIRHPKHIYVMHQDFCAVANIMRPYVAGLDYLVCRHLWGGFLERRCTRPPTRVVGVSQAVIGEAHRYHGCQANLIHNCVDGRFRRTSEPKKQIRTSLALPIDKQLILVVGRREKLKGGEYLQAIGEGLPTGTELISIGSGRSTANNASYRVIPACPPDLIPRYYQAADWVLSPSLYEGFGLTILESLACGTPIISFPTGVVRELLGKNRAFDACVAGIPGSLESIQAAIARALANPELGEEQIRWSSSSFGDKFSESTFQDRWGDLLESLSK